MNNVRTDYLNDKEFGMCLLFGVIIGFLSVIILFPIIHHENISQEEKQIQKEPVKSYGTCSINGVVFLCDAKKTFENFADKHDGRK